MTIEIYQIDAFTNTLFGGNPAAVCPLKEWLPDALLLNIAKENNLAETAYFIHKHDNVFHLKWFTPEIEIDLCGHATLASAYVILNYLDYDFNAVIFQTMSGELTVTRRSEFLEMDLPSRPPQTSTLPEIIQNSLSKQPLEIYKSRDYVLVYESENDIKNLNVSASILEAIDLSPGGIIVTAKGNDVDFVSRFFTPGAAVFEDPVTGSAHCTLVPFWAERLGKTQLVAHQISERHGELHCKLENQTVQIKGQAVIYLQGQIEI